MTITVVQSKVIPDAWSGSLTGNVAIGNTIFLVPTDYNTTTATMTATAPLYNGSPVTGATLLEAVSSGSTTPVYTGIWMLPAVASSAKTVAVTMNNGIGSSPTAGAVGLIAIEVAGLGASPSQDKGNTGSATTGTAVTSNASGAITTVPEFVLASLVIFGQSMSPVGGAWTELQFTDDFSLCGYQVVTSGSASYTYAATGAGSAAWSGVIATVKGTAAAAAATAPPVQLVPPGIGSPMAFTRRALPSRAPQEAADQDSGSGADAGAVTVTVTDSDTGSGADTPSLTVSAPGTDAGSGAESAAVTAAVSDSDAGSGAEGATAVPAGVQPPSSAVLIPPGPFTPMAFQRRAVPSAAPVLTDGQDAGSGTDSAAVGISDADTGTGADSGTVTAAVSDSDTGSGTETSAQGALVQAFPLTPPGLSSPMAWRFHAQPSQAPAEVASRDTGGGTDAASLPVPGAFPLTPPGIASPMAWQRHAWPSPSAAQPVVASSDSGSGAEVGTVTVTVTSADTGAGADSATAGPPVPSADTGAGADTGLVAVPVTGSGITWQLNPVRESMSGLDVGLHLSQALGGVLQFANHGSERLYVLSSEPGVTLTLLTGGMVLDQGAQAFPAVTLAPSVLYCFGPFHSAVQVPGTNLVQVLLSTAYGVQAVVVQGPDAH